MPWLRSCKALAYTRAEAVLRYRASWLLANLHGHRTRNSFWIAASICIRLIGPCVGGPVGRLTHSRKAMLVPFLRCHGYKFGGFFIGMPIDRKLDQRSACGLCQLYIVHDRAQFGLSLVSGRSLALATTWTSKRLLWPATPLATVIVHRDYQFSESHTLGKMPHRNSRAALSEFSHTQGQVQAWHRRAYGATIWMRTARQSG